MISLPNFVRRLKSPFTYNIGFIEITPEELVKERGFGKRKIHWMSHKYIDRWFADPFILDVKEGIITVLAEEKRYGIPGTLVRLDIDSKSYRLVKRTTILGLNTHLSYPNPIRVGEKVFVYPENSASGNLKIYELVNGSALKYECTLISEPLNDSSIFYNPIDHHYYLIATNTDLSPHNYTLLFRSKSILGQWQRLNQNPIINDSHVARPGGNFFRIGDSLYRPAQDCFDSYGKFLHIMRVNNINPWIEEELFNIHPSDKKYSEGLHTLNFHDSGLAVIDGNGYAYPFLGKTIGALIEKILHH